MSTHTNSPTMSRQDAVRKRAEREHGAMLDELRTRADYLSEYEYFMERLTETPAQLAQRVAMTLVASLCIQAPLEIFHALGLFSYRISCASLVLGLAAAPALPTLACPLLRSCLGMLANQPDSAIFQQWLIPTTCDWVVKFPEMARLAGLAEPDDIYWLELPHLKDAAASQGRWGAEVKRLVRHLEKRTGRRLGARSLERSMEIYQDAWRVFTSLIERRREGAVPAVWFILMANALYRDCPKGWAEAVERVIPRLLTPNDRGKRVFLAGSPVFYPNYKIPSLLEEAGLRVTADDLCSSERIIPGAVHYRDPSLDGLVEALAERYHQGCLCPTFADNERRLGSILSQRESFDGVVFQVLKGCHPYDLESFVLEKAMKEHGIRFIRIETDYAAEDRQNILTRLEAFRASL